MKRVAVVAVTAVVAAFFAGGGQAQAAAPEDPVTAVQKQFAPGRGVRVSEANRTTVSGIKGVFLTRTSGVIGFGKSAAVDYDLTSKTKLTDEQKAALGLGEDYEPATLRAVKVGRATYVKGFEWGDMPEGKHWVRFSGSSSWNNDGQRGDQRVDVLNPAILKLVIAKATFARAGEYRGALSGKELYKGKYGNSEVGKISFRLFVDRDRLPVRLITEYSLKTEVPKDGKLVKATVHDIVDTRYSGWGAKVAIAAPPAGEVVDFDDLKWPSVDDNPISALTDAGRGAVGASAVHGAEGAGGGR
ncbi:hypothetical protein ACWENQ_37745 [Nonomuraea sp. NPDC004354]